MFGQMKAQAILQVSSGSPREAVEALTKLTDNAQPVRWIDFPMSMLLLVAVPGAPDSGAVYVLDRKTRTWFWLDFEDEQYSGYSVDDFDLLVREYDFLSLVERPGLLRAKQGWLLEPGKKAETLPPSK
ncbi:MAG TPA: hypothetical protein VHQ22_01830 [Terriglobales bacterium]|jgi:hypothetical protein|nr:hypothetical protein [Terriglobales bacterium]